MIQGLLGRHADQIRRGSFPERTAGSGQNQLGNLITPTGAQALVGSVMLAVNRDQFGSRSLLRGCDQTSAGHQDFLIGKPDPFSEPNRRVSRFQAFHANDRRHDESGLQGPKRQRYELAVQRQAPEAQCPSVEALGEVRREHGCRRRQRLQDGTRRSDLRVKMCCGPQPGRKCRTGPANGALRPKCLSRLNPWILKA